jgi:hypothetical protein
VGSAASVASFRVQRIVCNESPPAGSESSSMVWRSISGIAGNVVSKHIASPTSDVLYYDDDKSA